MTGGSSSLVKLIARGPSDRASGAAAHALAVLLDAPSPDEAKGDVLKSEGLKALAALLSGDPRSTSVADAVASLGVLVTGNPPAQVLAHCFSLLHTLEGQT